MRLLDKTKIHCAALLLSVALMVIGNGASANTDRAARGL